MKRLSLTLICLVLVPCSAAHATVVGWGPNHRGELGGGYRSAPQAPVEARELGPVTQVVATYHSSYALLANGTVLSWGGNVWGQLGDGTHRESNTPVHVRGLSGVTQIAAGGAHGMALLSNGTVETWGSDMFGTLGNGTTGAGHEKGGSDVPLAVPGLSGVVAIAAGGADNYALLSNGTLMAWGENKSGQLGDGTTTEKDVPTPVKGVSGVQAVAAGGIATLGGHTLALLDNGTVLAWGANGSGQLGNGSTANSTAPVPVRGLKGVAAVSASVSHSLALLSNGTVESWGNNEYGELGAPSSDKCSGSPCSKVPESVLSGASAISAGFRFSVAISGGQVLAWGVNEHGQLGDGTQVNKGRPVAVRGVSGALAVSAGEYHTLAITGAGGPKDTLESQAGSRSLTVHWPTGAPPARWMIAWRPALRPAPKWSRAVMMPAGADGYTITGLAAQEYEVLVRYPGFGVAVISGTPFA